MNDPIVDEIRRVRDEYAARFNYDLDAIYKDIKEREKRSGRKFVSYGPDGSLLTSTEGVEAEPDITGTAPAPVVESNDGAHEPSRQPAAATLSQ